MDRSAVPCYAGPKMLRGSCRSFFLRFLLALMLAVSCAPFTFFEEAGAYLADTENELVHYYLTPLPDNGEACVQAPRIALRPTAYTLLSREFAMPAQTPPAAFFHPPQ